MTMHHDEAAADDSELLRRFVARRDEHAFDLLVRRYVDLVYSAARRQIRGDDAAANDITQQVFVLLAEKARTIRDGEALAGWLLVTTRFVSLNFSRAESRRRRNEHEAAVMQHKERLDEPATDWAQVGPMLDEAVGKLRREDRDALALRYFQGRSVADVAQQLGVSQDAAQKRLGRALERLRDWFARRGVTTSAEALSSCLLANVLITAPAALSTGVAGAALTSAASAAASSTTKGALALMGLSTGKIVTASVAAVVLVSVTGTIAYQTMRTPGGKGRQVRVENVAEPTPGAGGGGGAARRGLTATIAPLAATNPNWQQPFEAAYKLAPGENLKRIPTPFIPERADFYRTNVGRGQYEAMPQGADGIVIVQDSTGALRGRMWRFGNGFSGRDLLRSAIGIASREVVLSPDLPADLLDRELPGDWVFRDNSPIEARLSDLVRAISGKPVQVTRESRQQEVIVVSGTYAYRGLDGATTTPTANRPQQLHFYLGQPDKNPQHVGGGGAFKSALDDIGDSTGRLIIVDAKLPPRMGVQYHWHRSFMTAMEAARRTNNGVLPAAQLDEILANLSKQTGLNIRREQRAVQLWVTTPAQ